MVTAVDTSVLLDVLLNDPQHSGPSIAALRQAANEGSLVICETVLAEIVPTLAPADVAQFLSDWNLTFAPSSQPSALLAGEMFRTYLQRGGKRGRVVPDFLIAAHAPNTTRNVSWPVTADTTATISRSFSFGIRLRVRDGSAGIPSG